MKNCRLCLVFTAVPVFDENKIGFVLRAVWLRFFLLTNDYIIKVVHIVEIGRNGGDRSYKTLKQEADRL